MAPERSGVTLLGASVRDSLRLSEGSVGFSANPTVEDARKDVHRLRAASASRRGGEVRSAATWAQFKREGNDHGRKCLQSNRTRRNQLESWEKATATAINRAGKTLRDLRVAEVVKLDVQLKNGKIEAYRSRISVSFKYESES
jgi:flavin-binding protein dodecin